MISDLTFTITRIVLSINTLFYIKIIIDKNPLKIKVFANQNL